MKLKYLLIILILVTLTIVKNVYSKENKIILQNPSVLKNEISFILQNKEKEDIYIKSIEIIVKDNENSIICKALIPINKKIEKQNILEIKHKTNYDLTNSTKIDYIIN